MPKPVSYDVWLVRLDGTDKARLVAAKNLFRVDVRGAEHILARLPRVLARAQTPEAARTMVQQLNAIGGVAHLCASGETPDFSKPSAEPELPPPPARVRRTGDIAGEHARAVQDAAALRWPEDPEPYAWETDPSQHPPPPVPRPVRHSATRVAGLLAGTLIVLGGGAATYWLHFGHDLTHVSLASWRTPAAAIAPADAGAADDDEAIAADAGTAVPAATPAAEAKPKDEEQLLEPSSPDATHARGM